MTIDFAALNERLLSEANFLLPVWLPGGKMVGKEYVCGTLQGGPGNSVSVNLRTGGWGEFNGMERGRDLISLYAKINGMKNGEAGKILSEQFHMTPVKTVTAKPVAPPEEEPALPPDDTVPPMEHFKFGKPVAFWTYRTSHRTAMFYVARYEPKTFLPWSWMPVQKKWRQKGWPTPRPLYGLEELYEQPDKPVIVVEGEKTCKAARKIAGNVYVVVAWPNGVAGVGYVDFSPLRGRKVVLWPDADAHVAKDESAATKYGVEIGEVIPYDQQPGPAAMARIATILAPLASEVRVLRVDGMKDGWDAADALAEGMNYVLFKKWALPRLGKPVVVAPPSVPVNVTADKTMVVAGLGSTVNITSADEGIPEQTPSLYDAWDKLKLFVQANGIPVYNTDNALRVIENHADFKDFVWFDTFHQKYFTKWGSGQTREWKDIDDMNLLAMMQRTLGLRKMGDSDIRRAVSIYAHQRPRNEPKDWMEKLEWDKEHRITKFLPDYMGCEDNRYTRAVGENFWIALAARIFRPGCQMDNMIIFEGKQGSRKTSTLRAIGGPWYTSMLPSVQDTNFFQVLQGKLIIEIPELEPFSKADINRIKQVASTNIDRYRAPYERRPEDHPRQSVFCITTNEETYLRDATGARRFWPVKCDKIDVEAILHDRDQLFAEAVAHFKDGATWHEMPAGITEAEQEARYEGDEWEDIMKTWLTGREATTITEVAVGALKIDIAKLDRQVQIRIGKALRRLAWFKGDRDGKKMYLNSKYVKAEERQLDELVSRA